MTYYAWFIVFTVVAYFIVTDDSVAAAFYYVLKLAKANYEKQKWWLLHNPRNPVVKYMMHRRSMKLAKELMDEYENK
jgi:hypothetical protein